MTHSPMGFDWDDLKHLLAVARHGSTLAAGRALGVDQSTVQRRLVELERRIGQSLVQRQPTGYRLTEFGLEMLPFAEAVERSARICSSISSSTPRRSIVDGATIRRGTAVATATSERLASPTITS